MSALREFKVYKNKGKIINEQTIKIEIGSEEDVTKALIDIQNGIKRLERQKQDFDMSIDMMKKEEAAIIAYLDSLKVKP